MKKKSKKQTKKVDKCDEKLLLSDVSNSDEVQKIINGELTPTFVVVYYGTPEKQKELKKLLKVRKEIMKRTKVDWKKLNEFRITI